MSIYKYIFICIWSPADFREMVHLHKFYKPLHGMSRSVCGCMASLSGDYTAAYGFIRTVERLIELI